METYKPLCIVALVLCGGCSKEPSTDALPVVNAENCKKENIERIQPKSAREEFSSKCLRMHNFAPSDNPKSWGPGDL